MVLKIIALIQHRHATKLFSILLGYSLWFCIAQYQTVCKNYTAPIFFYDTDQPIHHKQETVSITLQGSRKDMHTFNPEHATLHIDGSKLREGSQEVMLSKENLFLPDTINLIDLTPSHISIQV